MGGVCLCGLSTILTSLADFSLVNCNLKESSFCACFNIWCAFNFNHSLLSPSLTGGVKLWKHKSLRSIRAAEGKSRDWLQPRSLEESRPRCSRHGGRPNCPTPTCPPPGEAAGEEDQKSSSRMATPLEAGHDPGEPKTQNYSANVQCWSELCLNIRNVFMNVPSRSAFQPDWSQRRLQPHLPAHIPSRPWR